MLSEFEQKRSERILNSFIERKRPPTHVRNKLDLAYRLTGQSVEIFEIRPLWDEPEKRIEEPVAKATYVKSKKRWKVYWQRADLKWHAYDPCPEVVHLEDFIDLVEHDEFCCFFG